MSKSTRGLGTSSLGAWKQGQESTIATKRKTKKSPEIPPGKDPENAETLKTSVTLKTSAKERVTFWLPKNLAAECRAAVEQLSGPPERLQMGTLAESALRRELTRLAKKHDQPDGFGQREEPLKGGRPVKAG